MQIWSFDGLISQVAAVFVLMIGLMATPALAQSTTASDPAATSVSEQQLLDEFGKIKGRITIPDQRAATLQQPEGRDYQSFQRTTLPWVGAIAVLGMLLALVLFFFIRGRVRTQAGESGRKIVRFNAFERLMHWTTATAFIVLGITGLNLIFGKSILMPLIGPEAFSAWSSWGKSAHHYVSWAFMLGVLLMFVMWVWQNLPDRYDANWIKSAGGLLDKTNRTHPPAGRFNTGQKLVFWSVVIGGGLLSVTGIYLMFPFSFADITGMQTAQYVHAIVGVLMVAVILAHIYIGTVGMEGAFEAMGTGEVDLNWAKEHHSAWVAEEEAKGKISDGTPPRNAKIQPAE